MDQIEEAERQRELEELKRMAALTPEVLTNIKRSVVECITLSTITGDFGDFFELTTGIDACTGERLGISGRIAAGLGLIVGSRLFWNMVGNGLVDTSRAVTKQIEKGVDDFIAFLNKYGISSPSEMVHFISFSRKHWDLKVASHVVEGDIGTHGIISKLTGGMHTSKGLSKSMNEVTKVKIDGESVDWVVKNIDDPTNNLSFVVGVHGRVTNTNVILKKTLPNGVSILQLPREFGNKGVFTKDALINGVDGYKGMKSLFPSHWDFKDITNATEHIIKDKAAAGVIIPSIGEKEIYGFYHIANEPPVKIRINFTDGKITTSHPTWNQ
jgi:hypothetical protein